ELRLHDAAAQRRAENDPDRLDDALFRGHPGQTATAVQSDRKLEALAQKFRHLSLLSVPKVPPTSPCPPHYPRSAKSGRQNGLSPCRDRKRTGCTESCCRRRT